MSPDPSTLELFEDDLIKRVATRLEVKLRAQVDYSSPHKLQLTAMLVDKKTMLAYGNASHVEIEIVNTPEFKQPVNRF